MSFRRDRLSTQIKHEISGLFLQKLKDPAFGLITVTNVNLSPDLRIAKVYISVYDREKREATLGKVNEVKGIIRSVLAEKIRMRFVPELVFYIDDTLDYVERIEDIFRRIKENGSENSQ